MTRLTHALPDIRVPDLHLDDLHLDKVRLPDVSVLPDRGDLVELTDDAGRAARHLAERSGRLFGHRRSRPIVTGRRLVVVAVVAVAVTAVVVAYRRRTSNTRVDEHDEQFTRAA